MRSVRATVVVAVVVLALVLGAGWAYLHRSSLLGRQRAHTPQTTAPSDRLPVAVLSAGGQAVTVAADGTLLPHASSGALPTISLGSLPGGARVTDPRVRAVLAVLAAAPSQLLDHAGTATDGAAHGVVIGLRDGPRLYFGDAQQQRAKWIAATAVLADASSRGAAYIDLTDPERPAAG
jgi:Cell division protein FtsQ